MKLGRRVRRTNRLLRARLFAGVLLLGLADGAVFAEEDPGAGRAAFTVRAVKSGSWSDAGIWEPARVPRGDERVLISRKTRVTYDLESPDVIRYLQVAGTLTFARDRNTTLNAGIISVQPSDDYLETGFECSAHPLETKKGDANPGAALEAGTPEAPIPHPFVARIRLHFLAGMDKNDGPAIVCCGGRMDLHGAPMERTWLRLGQDAAPGAGSIVLSEAVAGWRVGDEVLITGAKLKYGKLRETGDTPTETRRIAGIDGATVRLDQPLKYQHAGGGEFRSEAANLSRNVIVESADPAGVRGHTMYHNGSAGSISYARFAHLGKEGVLGRYPIHFHLAGTSMRGSSVVGVAIVDSHNRWVTIHGTQYLLVRDCVGYRSVGHGFFLEDATEVNNLLDRNLAVQAFHGKRLPKQVLPFDANDGAGFWWANGRNSLVRNVACENGEYGFRYDCQKTKAFSPVLPILMPDGSTKDVDVRTIPITRFDDNEAHGSFYGMVVAANGNSQPDDAIRDQATLERIKKIDWTGPDARHPHVIRNLKIWETHYGFRPHSPSMLMENIRIDRVTYGIYRPAFDNQVYRKLHLSHNGPEPFNRSMDDASAQVGRVTVDGLTFSESPGDQRHPLVHMSDLDLSGKAECHFRNVAVDANPKRRPIFNRGGTVRADPICNGVPYFIHDYFGPGRSAKIVSTKAADLLKDGNDYRALPPLTGDESVAAEVKDLVWPELLDPVDDLPPATIVLSIRSDKGRFFVRGVTHDNGKIVSVKVNGEAAKLTAIQDGVVDWEAELEIPQDRRIAALGVDEAGNREMTGHSVTVK